MLRFILWRLASAVPTLFLVVTLSFFLIRFAPGGPGIVSVAAIKRSGAKPRF